MLAGDPAEASEQAERFIKERPLVDYYDEIMVPGLRLAQDDVDDGLLEPERLKEIHEAAEGVIDALADSELVPKKSAGQKQEQATQDESNGKQPSVCEPVDANSLAPAWRHESAILCIAGRTPLDDIAARALEQLLVKCGLGAKAIAAMDARRGSLQAELSGARLICISALDVRERSAHARFLARRLIHFAPEATLLGGFWVLDPQDARDRKIVETIPVDEAAYSLRDALSFCMAAARGGDRPKRADRSATPATVQPGMAKPRLVH